MTSAALPELSPQEEYLLGWLGGDESSAYGECHGKELDRLVELGLASVGRGRHEDVDGYSRVVLTEYGQGVLGQLLRGFLEDRAN